MRRRRVQQLLAIVVMIVGASITARAEPQRLLCSDGCSDYCYVFECAPCPGPINCAGGCTDSDGEYWNFEIICFG